MTSFSGKRGQQLGEPGWTQAAHQHVRAAALDRQLAGDLHATMAVDVGDHDDEVGAIDQCLEHLGAARMGAPGVAFHAMTLLGDYALPQLAARSAEIATTAAH